MKSFLSLLLCAALLLGLLTGCVSVKPEYIPTGDAIDGSDPTSGQDSQDKEDTFALAYYPDRSLNPFQCTDYTNRVLFSLIYQGLFAVDKDYQVHPVLCHAYNVTADMKTYTFQIAESSFSDGTAVTAEDVRASLEAAKVSPYYGGRLQHVTKISAFGDKVMTELDIPMENLPMLLDIPIVKASEVNAETPLGSGPYLLDNSLQGKWLRRQAGWWCNITPPVNHDFISLVPGESTAQIRDIFEFGQIDLVCAAPGNADYVDFRSDYEFWNSDNGIFLYMVCNKKSKFFQYPGVQAALTHAIDRNALVEKFYHGFAYPASLPVLPSSPWHSASLAEKFSYSPQKFRDALLQVPEEERKITILLCSDDIMRIHTGQAIAEMLTDCGVSVTVNQVPGDKFDENLRWSTYDLYIGQTKLSANMDLSAFFSPHGSMNYAGLSNPSLYSLSLDALANGGNFYNLFQKIMEDGQLCPILFQEYAIYASRGSLSKLVPARDNLFYYDLGRKLSDALISGE